MSQTLKQKAEREQPRRWLRAKNGKLTIHISPKPAKKRSYHSIVEELFKAFGARIENPEITRLKIRIERLEKQASAVSTPLRLAGMKPFAPGTTLADVLEGVIGTVEENDPHWAENATREYRDQQREETV